MSPLKVVAVATVALSVLTLGACGSDSSGEADPRTSSSPTTAEPTTAPTTVAPKPSPSASTTAPPTTAAPTGDLIEYEDADGDGVYVTTAADTAKLKGAPADFKTFIAAELVRNPDGDEGCTEPPSIYVSRLDTGGWARGGYSIPDCGGYGALWAKTKGSWKEVWSGQSLIECTTLETYAIPSRVAGDQCLKGSDAVPYQR